MRRLGLWVVVAAMTGLAACGGGSSSSTTATTTSVIISPTATQNVTPTQTVTFTATVNSTDTSTGVVTNITSTGVTWEVNGTASGAAATGTISTTGVYTPPSPPVTVATQVTVTAVSVSDTTASASTTIDLVPQPEITIAPTTATVPAGQTQTFTVTYSSAVTTQNQVVSWYVNNVPGGNSTYGQVSAAGVYSPPQVPPSGQVTVTAVLQSDTSQTAPAAVTDTYGAASLVHSYAFLIRGETTKGRFLRAGSFTADGKGNITGIEDINGVALPAPTAGGTSFTGTYSVGADGRGTLLFNDGFGSNFGTSKFSIVIVSAGQVQIAESDVFASGSGEADLQSSPPTATAPSGTYVFDFSGTDASANPLSIIGEFNSASGGLDDIDDNGTLTPSSPVTTFSYSLGTSGGRSTATLVDSSGTRNFSFYKLPSNRLRFIELDPVPASVVGGDAVAQSAPSGGFNVTLLSGSLLAATTGTNSTGAVATVASFTASGAGTAQPVTVVQNNVGAVTTQPAAQNSSTYMVASNGRGMLTLGTGQTYVFYLIAPGQGVIQETDQVVSSTVSDGVVVSPFVNPPPLTSLSASVAIQWSGAGTAAPSPGEQDATGQFVASSGTFKAGTLDSNTANGNNVSAGFTPALGATLTPTMPYLLSTAGAPLNVVVGPQNSPTNLQFAVFFTSPTSAIILRVDMSDKRTLSGIIAKQF